MPLIKVPDILSALLIHHTAVLAFVHTPAFSGAKCSCIGALCWPFSLPATTTTATISSTHHVDGLLKDTNEINWYNDADDDTPMLPPPPPPAHNGTLSSFIHCSGHAVKPMEKVCETASSNSAKWSAPGPPQGAPAPNQEDENKDTGEEAPLLKDFMDDEEENENEEAYQRMKNLVDQDHEGCKSLKKDECSADLTMVFTFEKGHVNPHMQEHENR